MITILNANKEKLIDHISKCSGCVFLHLTDGTFCDIKNDAIAARMFGTMDIPKKGIQLSLSDPNDYPKMIQYMLDSHIST